MFFKISLLILFLAVMACLGIFAGKTDSKKRFFFFSIAGVWAIGIYFLVAYLLVKYCSIYINSVYRLFPWIGATVFLCAYNCQRNTSKWWKSLLWLLACITIKSLLLLFVWVIVMSISVLFDCFKKAWEGGFLEDLVYFHNSWGIVAVTIFVSAVIWTIFTFRTKNFSVKNIIKYLGYYTSIVIVGWGLVFLITEVSFYRVQRKAKELGIMPMDIFSYSYTCPDNTFYHNPLYQPPYSGRYNWLKDQIPKEELEFTLKNFNSPEAQKSLDNLHNYIDENISLQTNFLSNLNSYRYACRRYCDRAVLFNLTGEADKMFAEYDKYLELDKKYEDIGLITYLVQVATRTIWGQSIVINAPDEEKYASWYRKNLEWSKSWKVILSNEAGFYLTDQRLVRYRLDTDSKLILFIAIPIEKAVRCNGFYGTLKMFEKYNKLKDLEVFEFDGSQYITNLYRQRLAIVLNQIIFALKTYRAENGKYPDSLNALVPNYLDRIPPNPLKGEEFDYSSDGENFILLYNKERGQKIDTRERIKFPKSTYAAFAEGF